MRQSASIVAHILKNTMLESIENTIDEEKKIKHNTITNIVEKVLETPEKISKKVFLNKEIFIIKNQLTKKSTLNCFKTVS
jgi:hypothetical protein